MGRGQGDVLPQYNLRLRIGFWLTEMGETDIVVNLIVTRSLSLKAGYGKPASLAGNSQGWRLQSPKPHWMIYNLCKPV